MPIFKLSHISNITNFLKRFFAYNNNIVTVDLFFICLTEFYFLTQSDDFAKAIAFAWRPFLPILKLSHFSNIRSFLKRLFA